MALIDVVKCESNSEEFVTKFDSTDLRIGTQLVVHPGQTAFFVKGGAIFDQFGPGTYTISTNNIPLLNKIINLPFGKESPFQAEIWFINTLNILDTKWGTQTPIQIEDPIYSIIVPIRAYGQYGLKIADPRLFLESLVGNMRSFSKEKVDDYFRGKVLSSVTNLISEKMTEDKLSFLNINSHVNELSEYSHTHIRNEFVKFGIDVVNFYIIAISIPPNDPSLTKLKESKDFAARLKITGKDVYQMERSYDVLEKAAANEGIGGSMMAMGVGLGTGVGVGGTIGQLYSQNMNTGGVTPPPVPPAIVYFAYIDGQQIGDLTVESITGLIASKKITPETLIWTRGMKNWVSASQMPELATLFEESTPPPIPQE